MHSNAIINATVAALSVSHIVSAQADSVTEQIKPPTTPVHPAVESCNSQWSSLSSGLPEMIWGFQFPPSKTAPPHAMQTGNSCNERDLLCEGLTFGEDRPEWERQQAMDSYCSYESSLPEYLQASYSAYKASTSSYLNAKSTAAFSFMVDCVDIKPVECSALAAKYNEHNMKKDYVCTSATSYVTKTTVTTFTATNGKVTEATHRIEAPTMIPSASLTHIRQLPPNTLAPTKTTTTTVTLPTGGCGRKEAATGVAVAALLAAML